MARSAGNKGQEDTPMKETLSMIAASTPSHNPTVPLQLGRRLKSPNTKRRTKKNKKKVKSKTPTNGLAPDHSISGDSDAADAGSSIGRLSGVSSISRERKDNPVLNNLLMQIERLEIQNIGSKLKEHKSRSVLTDEKRKYEGALKEVEIKLSESQNEVHQLKQNQSNLLDQIVSSEDSFSALQSKLLSQENSFLGIIAKQHASHAYTRGLQERAKGRAANSDVLNALHATILENEHLSEELVSLRSSVLQLSEVIEHIELESMEKDFEIRKLSSAVAAAGPPTTAASRGSPTSKPPSPSPTTPFSPPKLMKLGSFNRSTSQMSSLDRQISEKSPAAKHASAKKDNVTSLISSWFGDAEDARKDGRKVGEKESRVIENAVLDAASRASQEAEEKKKSLKLKGQQERAKFMKAAKSLKKGPGKMVVALTKSEKEVEFLKEKIKMLEERDAESRALLEKAEETILGMVENAEREAASVLEMNFRDGVWGTHQKKPPPSSASSSNQEWAERCSQLEMQKEALLDLLKSYDGSAEIDLAGMPVDLAKLAVYDCGSEVKLREALCRALGIAGGVKDDDILTEVKYLGEEVERLKGKVKKWENKKEEGAILVVGEGMEENEAVHDLVVAKEIQMTHSRSRQHSAALSDAKRAAEAVATDGLVRPPPSPPLVEDVDLVSSIQDERAAKRKHTVEHSMADEALKSIEKFEGRKEDEKAKLRGRSRQHSVAHRSAPGALTEFIIQKKRRREEGSDEDSDSEDGGDGAGGVGLEKGAEGREVGESEEGGSKLPHIDVDIDEVAEKEQGPWSPEITSEEIHHEDLRLLLHRQKIFTDPLGNDVNLTMSTYLIPDLDLNQYARFRIKAYDKEVGRELCMDVNEVDLRNSLKHDPKTFTYNDKDEVFHEKVLDRLILVPTHDLNNDGFLNADDVIRDDLNLALVGKESWTPIRTSIEVGPRAAEKKRKQKEEEERRRRERESALKDHQMHSERLINKERVRQRSISERGAATLFMSLEDDKEILEDNRDTTDYGDDLVNLGDGSGPVFEKANDLIIDASGEAHFEKHKEVIHDANYELRRRSVQESLDKNKIIG